MKNMPRPSDYGLPENVEEAYKNEEKRYKENSKKIYREEHKNAYIKTLAITFIVSVVIYCISEGTHSILELLLFSAIMTIGSTGWMVGADWLWCVGMKSPYHLFWKSEFYKNYQRYKSDIREYSRKQQAQTQEFWLMQTGHQFEAEVAKVYQMYGYKTAVSRAGGDGGIDIVLTKGTEKIAVQCKHHSKPVAPAVIRDLYGTMLANGFSKGILVSLKGFTQGTKDFAKGKPIELVDMNDLILMSKKQSK